MSAAQGTPSLSNFPGGFSGGLTVRGIPITQAHPGKVFYVNNSSVIADGGVAGSDGNPGTYQRPMGSIAGALAKCTANRGDIIFLMPGHAETVTGAGTTAASAVAVGTTLSLNVAGVAIIGLGAGATRPTITFTTANTANIPVTAANITLQNCLFVANFLAVASVFTATSTNTPTDFAIEGCEFKDTSSVLNFVSIITGNATANSMDGLYFSQNRISSVGTTAATTAIKILSTTNRLTITKNYGNWAVLNDTAAMLSGSTFQITNLEFGANILQRPNTSSTGGSFVSGSGNAWVGHCYDNYMYQVDNTAGIWIATGHGTALGFTNNFSPITGAADASALINPAAA